ncbi:hypothetical protein BH09PSE1_BH09PSE1_23470 [soil metagenome]
MLKSSLRRVLMCASALSLMLACGACASGSRMPTILAAVQCGPLIPESLRRDVPGADLPADDSAGAWVAFGDAQTGRLDVANANKLAVVQIVDACDRQQAAIREALKPKAWWRIF